MSCKHLHIQNTKIEIAFILENSEYFVELLELSIKYLIRISLIFVALKFYKKHICYNTALGYKMKETVCEKYINEKFFMP